MSSINDKMNFKPNIIILQDKIKILLSTMEIDKLNDILITEV